MVFLLYCSISFILGYVSPIIMSEIVGGKFDGIGGFGFLSIYILYYVSIFYVWYYYDSMLIGKKIYGIPKMMLFIPFIGLFIYFVATRSYMLTALSIVLFSVVLFTLYFVESFGAWLSLR